MKDINPEEILTWDLEKLWNFYVMIKENRDDKEYHQIKFGTKLIIPIRYLIEEWYEMYPTTKKVRVLGFGKFNITEFTDEIEEREKALRKAIEEEIQEDEIAEPRT